MIGDDLRDVEAGQAAGCKDSYLIDENSRLLDVVNMILSEDV